MEALEQRVLLSGLSEFRLPDPSGAAVQMAAAQVAGEPLFDAYVPVTVGQNTEPMNSDLFWLANHLSQDDLAKYDRIDSALLKLYSRRLRGAAADLSQQTINHTPYAQAYETDGGLPLVEVYVDDVAAMTGPLKEAGLDVVDTYDHNGYRIITARLPIDAVAALAQLDGVRRVVASLQPILNASGAASNQAEMSALSDQLKRVFPNLDGGGIDIGVMSDSMNQVGNGIDDSQATGDLPPDARITNLDDGPSGATDEGRGMAELIYDVGSGFDFLNHTGNGRARMAAGYDELRVAGADVIVDDIAHFDEPVFYDGLISAAINDVYLDHGVLVFGAAGNQDDGGYNAAWSDSDNDGLHNFGGSDESLSFTLGGNVKVSIALHWSQFEGFDTTTDLDIEIYDDDGNEVADSDGFNLFLAPVDFVTFTNPSSSTKTFHMKFRETLLTSADGLLLYVIMNSRGSFNVTDGYADGEPSIAGNHTSKWMLTIGATRYDKPNGIEGFSSRGPIYKYFDEDGDPIIPVEVRQKPDFVSFDGADTSFFGSADFDGTGFPNFFGTSAAAPNAAAIAGLILEQSGGAGSMTYTQMKNLLAQTAVGPGAGAWDALRGNGLIQALAAGLVNNGPVATEATVEFNPFGVYQEERSFNDDGDVDSYALAVEPSGSVSIDVDAPDYRVEPDDYADGTIIETVSAGVTLSHSFRDVKAIQSGSATTGSKLFGYGDAALWPRDQKLRMDFTDPVSWVAIDFSANGPSSSARLDVFDTAGNGLASFLTGDLDFDEDATLIISRPTADIGIAQVFSPGPDGNGGIFDNLRFGVDPSLLFYDRDGGDALLDLVHDDRGMDPAHIDRSLSTGRLYQLDVYNEGPLSAGGKDYLITVTGPAPPIANFSINAITGNGSTTGVLGPRQTDYYRIVAPAATTGNGFITLTPASTFNAVLTLYDDAGGVIQRVDANGNGGNETINFAGLTPGATYYVRVGSVRYANYGPYNFAVNFTVPITPNGKIRGRKFHDANSDGVQNGAEVGLADWIIFLDQNQNGTLDSGESFTRTDSNGDYEFDGLTAGDYFVAELQQSGWVQTFPFANPGFETGTFIGWGTIGDARVVRSDFNVAPPEGQFMALITTGPGAVSQAQVETFGLYNSGELDNTGAGDAIEGSMIRTVINAVNGTQMSFNWKFFTNQSTPSALNDFAFVGVNPTGGTVGAPDVLADTSDTFMTSHTSFNEETGWGTFTGSFIGSVSAFLKIGIMDEQLSTTDSALLIDNLQVTHPSGNAPPGTHPVTILGPTHIVSNINFGNRPELATEVHGSKFDDVDGDGFRDGGDAGLQGWTIYADVNRNGRLDDDDVSTVTDQNGDYVLSGLPAGTYPVLESPVPGWRQTLPASPGVRITEVDLVATDFIEIQNLSDQTIDTTNWQVVVSNSYTDINTINQTTWNIPDTMAGGEVRYRTDNAADNPWGNNILWSPGSSGWAMIVDNGGGVVDWVAWGWPIDDIVTFDVQVGGFPSVTLDTQWVGQGAANNGTGTLQRMANADSNRLADWQWTQPASKGAVNVGIGQPGHIVQLVPEQTLSNINFANTRPGQIQGRKFHDINGNGVMDGGEMGLTGWVIYVDEDDDGVLDVAGGVEPDDFADGAVLNTVAPGLTLSAVGSGITADVTAATATFTSTGVKALANSLNATWVQSSRELRGDFDEPVGRVSIDFISDDSSDIGQLDVYDAGDNLLGSYITASLGAGASETMTIQWPTRSIAYFKAYGKSGQVGYLDNVVFGVDEPTDTTDAAGNYSFTRLLLAQHSVREQMQPGWLGSSPAGGVYAVSLAPGSEVAGGIDFANNQPGEIRGLKWHDLNADGVRDAGEPVVPGWTIYIDADENGQLDRAGRIEPDDFNVGENLTLLTLADVTITAEGTGVGTGEVTVASHALASTGGRVFAHPSGATWVEGLRELRIDFAVNAESVSIDFISDDTSDFGVLRAYDAGDNLITSATSGNLGTGQFETLTVTRAQGDIAYVKATGLSGQTGLLDNLVYQLRGGEPVTVTDAGGEFRFTGLAPGRYPVREVQRDDWLQIGPNGVIDDFEDGNLDEYTSNGNPTATSVDPAAAHDGALGLLDGHDTPAGFLYRTDPAAQVNQGDIIDVWVNLQFATIGGRAHLLFGASDTDAYSVVIARNTQQLLIQRHPGYSSFVTLATVAQNITTNHWYRLEVDWGRTGQIKATLFDSDGQTVVNTISATDNQITTGGIGFRAFGNPTWFDTLTVNKPFVHEVPVLSNQTTAGRDFANYQLSPPNADAGGPYVIEQGQPVTLNASASTDPDGVVGDAIVTYQWDLDNDGDFSDAAGVSPNVPWSVLASLGLGAGSHTIAVRATDSFGLFDDDAAGLSILAYDYGDAPDPRYPTLRKNNPAKHLLRAGGPVLGRFIDDEFDGQPSADATGDDGKVIGNDDEDGVRFLNTPARGGLADIVVDLTIADGLLNAWVDWNSDGDWADAGEHIFTDKAVGVGTNLLSFAVPTNARLGPTFARFRLSTAARLDFDGEAPDGEVEDYQLVIDTAPRVAEVLVRGSSWTSGGAFNFVQYLADNGLGVGGFTVPTGAAQLTTIPWINANQIILRFSEEVMNLAANVEVRGTLGPDGALATGDETYALNLVSSGAVPAGGSGAFQAIYQLAAGSFARDKLLIDVDDAVTDLAGVALDGEWINAASTFNSGDNAPGGAFQFRLNVLPGDVVAPAFVLSTDVNNVIARAGSSTLVPALYSPFADVDGSGLITSLDVNGVIGRAGASLPGAEPTGPTIPLIRMAPPGVAGGFSPEPSFGVFTKFNQPVNYAWLRPQRDASNDAD